MKALHSLVVPFFLFYILPLSAIDSYEVGDQLHVLAPSGLRIRTAPQNGEKTELIPYSGKIEGFSGKWIKVCYKFYKGYVFDGFLSHVPAPFLGKGNFAQYLQKRWQAITPKIDSSVVIEGMDLFFTRQSFQYYSRKAYLSEDYNPDDESFSLIIDNISKEETYLLLNAFFKYMITDTKELLQSRLEKSLDFDSEISYLTEEVVRQIIKSYETQSTIPEKLSWTIYSEACFVEIGYMSTKRGWKIFVNWAAC